VKIDGTTLIQMMSPLQPADETPPAPAVQVRVVGQYIRDLSFVSPNVTTLMSGTPESPNLKLEINVNATQAGPDIYESAIDFKANATAKIGVIYEFELIYAAMFKIENAPEPSIEPILMVNCPMLLFPFMRRIVADVTREGGFPPLLLDPVDFMALYIRKRELAAQTT
jgi:preprotein translocase subunit SecB